MRRWICLALCCFCALGVWLCGRLWDGLSGQSLFRLRTTMDLAARDALEDIATDADVELGAFALRQAKLGDADILLYDCLSYHPEALGIVLLSGSPIIREQIAQGEPVVMLSERAASALHPSLDLLDRVVELDGRSTRVVGIYRSYEPLGPLTRAAAATAIAPMRPSTEARRIYVWLQSNEASPFAFEQAKAGMASLIKTDDAGEFQSRNLDGASRMNKQGIRFLGLLASGLLGLYALRAMAVARRRFYASAREAFSRHYALKACARLIGPFVCRVLPSLAVVAGWLAALVYCADRLLVSAERVPGRLLDPEAWLIKLESATVAGNLAEQMPVFGCLLNARLQWICPALGFMGLSLLGLGLCPIKKKAGDGM